MLEENETESFKRPFEKTEQPKSLISLRKDHNVIIAAIIN